MNADLIRVNLRKSAAQKERSEMFQDIRYRQVQQRTDVFSGVAEQLSIPWSVHGFVNSSGDIEQFQVQLVTGSYFPVLGVNAGLGGESSEKIEVIGVVKDAKYGSIKEQFKPMAFYPMVALRDE
ncbi:MAG TPA: hypothetical protein VLB46_21850 [Pyrinomonadaceae bacterium]|nr:hypothetical protein [Pyrinomonadaceae bacterium]